MITSVGERITYCRSILGISRKELAEKFSISLTTLTRWELNYIKVPEKKVKSLVSFFNNQGLILEYNWLVNGQGLSPLNTKLKEMGNLNYDELSFSFLNSLKQEIKGVEIFQINNDFFAPIISLGDYIAGTFIDDLKLLDNKTCFVVTKNQVLCGVFSMKTFSVKNMENKIFDLKINELKIGKILWMTNRF